MRVNPNMASDILADLQQSQMSLSTALQQLSTGKTVNAPSDNPAAAAAMVQNNIETKDVDQYTQNVTSALSTVETASAALSSVATALTEAVSVATNAANGTNNSANLQALAEQVQGILTSVVSEANTAVGGTFLFGGTASGSAPFTADASSPTGFTYNGNTDTNSVAVGDQSSIQVNLPGSQIFADPSNSILGSLNSLLTAIQSGNTAGIETASSSISSALGFLGQQQAFYANTENQLNAQDSFLQQDTVSLASQQNNLIGVDEATAATNLSQAEADNNAAQAAAAKVLPNTLLNFLSPPN
jgi:flagellar hook-associated protein 3 FlgL